jgi:hypothetical protein
MPNGISEALRKLEGIAMDFSSLRVRTYSGSLEYDVDGGGGGGNNMTIEDEIEAAKKEGNVKLIAETHIKIDGDSHYFARAEAPDNLLKAHQQAVKSGQETRNAIVDLFKEIVLNP